MARLPAFVSALALTLAMPALAQQAPPPEPSRDGSTLLDEPTPVTVALDFVGQFLGEGSGGEKLGFYPVFGRIISGAGWVSLGGGYRQRLFGDRAVIDGSTSVSWRAYKLAQGRFELTDLANSRVAVGTQVTWQDLTQLDFYGTGPESSVDDQSEYRLKTTDVVAYTIYRPVRWLSIAGRAGRLDGPTLSAPTGPFFGAYPDARSTFPDDPAFGLPRQPAFAHGRASVTADTRDFRDHPSRGGVYEAAWARYADLDFSAFSFSRFEGEAAHFMPFFNDGLVLAFRGWTVLSDTAEGQTVPAYLMPSLGGSATLRAFHHFRFHDRNLLLGVAEARVALTEHLDTAVFVDSGSVAAKVKDLRLGNNSYGVGLRLHTHKATTARVDAAHGPEGWRVLFSMSDPFRMNRLTRHAAAIPFAP